MRYRLFGQTGLRVSELFLGAMSFHEGDTGGAPADEARRILDLYDEAGGNVVDTADMYSAGQSESVVGALLEGRRDRFVLASKYTGTRDGRDPNAAGNHRKNLTLALEASLRRLRTDYLDIYWAHLWDRNTPVEETMRALDDAVRAGKILYTGFSDVPAWVVARANTLAEWRGWTPFAGIQVPYNLLNRDIERDLLPMAEWFGLTVTTWSSLAHGALSGSPKHSLNEHESAVMKVVNEVAAEVGATPSQVAIAWARSRSRAVHPILGASRAEQLKDTLGAVDLTLPGEAVARLSAATGFTAGFPNDFIDECGPVFGKEVFEKVDGR